MGYMLIFIVLRVAVGYTVMQLSLEMLLLRRGTPCIKMYWPDIPFYLPSKIFPEVSVEEFLPN